MLWLLLQHCQCTLLSHLVLLSGGEGGEGGEMKWEEEWVSLSSCIDTLELRLVVSNVVSLFSQNQVSCTNEQS